MFEGREVSLVSLVLSFGAKNGSEAIVDILLNVMIDPIVSSEVRGHSCSPE
jgi:uncharacterized membrane protein